MQKSLYQQLRDADKDLANMTPAVWFDAWPDQNHGIVYGATLIKSEITAPP